MKTFLIMTVCLAAISFLWADPSESGPCTNCSRIPLAQYIGNCCSSCGGQSVCTTCRANEVCFRDCHGGNNPAVSCHPTGSVEKAPSLQEQLRFRLSTR